MQYEPGTGGTWRRTAYGPPPWEPRFPRFRGAPVEFPLYDTDGALGRIPPWAQPIEIVIPGALYWGA